MAGYLAAPAELAGRLFSLENVGDRGGLLKRRLINRCLRSSSDGEKREDTKRRRREERRERGE